MICQKMISHNGLCCYFLCKLIFGLTGIKIIVIGSFISKDVLEQRTSTESDDFSLLICLDATTFA